MIYDELLNNFNKKKHNDVNYLAPYGLIHVREYGEYSIKEINIKKFSKYEFKGYQLMLVLDGHGTVRLNKQVIPLSVGDMIIFNADQAQIVSNGHWNICYMILEGEYVHKMMMNMLKGKQVFHFNNLCYMRSLFDEVYKSMEKVNDVYTSMYTCSQVLKLLSEVEKYDIYKEDNDSFEIKVLTYIEKHFKEDISVESIAEYFGYNSEYLIKKFKKNLKETPHNYILSRRILYAKDLLDKGRLSIKEISKEVGFNSESNFCVAFKRITKMTPKEYRNLSVERRMKGYEERNSKKITR